MITHTIVHPVTGDRAHAESLEAAELAARTLRNDAIDAGTCTDPRTRCLIAAGEHYSENDQARST
jgi:hypothetical protein